MLPSVQQDLVDLSSTGDKYDTIVETFEHFLCIMDEEGHIPEEHFDLGGIRMDKDINGKDVVRAATITQESYQ